MCALVQLSLSKVPNLCPKLQLSHFFRHFFRFYTDVTHLEALSMLPNLFRRVLFVQYINSHRCKSRWVKHYLRDLWGRRQLVGPEAPKPRSSQPNWNYEAELFAFGRRLGENFETDTLRKTFIHRSYVQQDAETRSKLQTSTSTSTTDEMDDNIEFIARGNQIISNYVKAFLRYHFRKLPEEGISVIHDHLASDENLSVVAKHIGTSDLILSSDFPLLDKTMRDSFAAVVGALNNDEGLLKAELFVRDFVLTQLVNLNINEIFHVANPLDVLKTILKQQKRGFPEPRLIRQSGSFTITPVYLVGIYSDKELIGSSPGETIEIATEMAARESLKTLWGINIDTLAPYRFQEHLDLSAFKEENYKLVDILKLDGVPLVLTSPLEDEPLNVENMTVMYKDKVEKSLGTPLLRRMKHRFFYGTFLRKEKRNFIKPKVQTI